MPMMFLLLRLYRCFIQNMKSMMNPQDHSTTDEAFSEVAQIPDGIFCHQGAFLCATGSRESTVQLVCDAIKA